MLYKVESAVSKNDFGCKNYSFRFGFGFTKIHCSLFLVFREMTEISRHFTYWL